MMPSSVLASCDDSGIAGGAKSIVSSAKTSTSTTGDKLPKAAIPSDDGVFIFGEVSFVATKRKTKLSKIILSDS